MVNLGRALPFGEGHLGQQAAVLAGGEDAARFLTEIHSYHLTPSVPDPPHARKGKSAGGPKQRQPPMELRPQAAASRKEKKKRG